VAIEWPTVGLAAIIYSGFGLLTWYAMELPLPLLAVAGAWLIAWQSSLQHEVLHGHPTSWRALNRMIALPPFILWLPYDVYRITHLVHHRDERLTDPFDDPESWYHEPVSFAGLARLTRLLVRVQTTLLGRMIIGPTWTMATFLARESKLVWRGEGRRRAIWRMHAPRVALLLVWVVGVCKIPLLDYVLFLVYPATALMLLRSFAEHRARSDVFERTAVIENAPVLGLLYLYNNFHAAHHEAPRMAWYRLPAWYRANRRRLLERNGWLVYEGYGDIARRFLVRPHDAVVHPLGRIVSRRQGSGATVPVALEIAREGTSATSERAA
jgi:fatty acid desaturase